MQFIYDLLKRYENYLNTDITKISLDDAIDLLELFSLIESEKKKEYKTYLNNEMIKLFVFYNYFYLSDALGIGVLPHSDEGARSLNG